VEYQKALNKAQTLTEKYGERSEYALNPDAERVQGLLEEMARNKVEFGAMYCPCMTKRLTGVKQVDAKRICPCKWHKEDIEQFGVCYCGLYVKSGFDESKDKGVPPSVWSKYD